MLMPRVIPCLLLKGLGLVKTFQFKDPKYVGDPINAVRIFNEKEVDELIFLDILATKEGRPINYELIFKIAQECFMPFAYGGGVRNIMDIHKILKLGAEKVVINTRAVESPLLIKKASEEFGSQSIVVSLDLKKTATGYQIFTRAATDCRDGLGLLKFIKLIEGNGVGELFINSIDRDGLMRGLDLDLIKLVAKNVSVPIIVCGGVGNLQHIKEAIEVGASAVSAGSLFVFYGRYRSVLINYPERKDLEAIWRS